MKTNLVKHFLQEAVIEVPWHQDVLGQVEEAPRGEGIELQNLCRNS